MGTEAQLDGAMDMQSRVLRGETVVAVSVREAVL